jgi:hypothetical protein
LGQFSADLSAKLTDVLMQKHTIKHEHVLAVPFAQTGLAS